MDDTNVKAFTFYNVFIEILTVSDKKCSQNLHTMCCTTPKETHADKVFRRPKGFRAYPKSKTLNVNLKRKTVASRILQNKKE